MSSNHKGLSGIPVKVINTALSANTGSVFHNRRRAVQILVLLLLVLIPVSGLLRIDPEAGAFVVIDRQIWFSDFFLIFGLWILIASSLIALYSTAGTVFCGWACPQNTLSEWANHMTHKLLGNRAEVSLTGEAPQVAAIKNKALNWILLALALLGASMLFALIPLLYFYPPDVVWSFVTFRHDERLAGSLYWIYTVWVLLILVDVAVVRHFWCRFACVYRVWQHSFKTKQTLHITYDASRSTECEKCNYCVTTCLVDIDPRKTDVYDSCINCGECIDACNRIHTKTGGNGLLSFELGERKQDNSRRAIRDNAISLLSRYGWTMPFALLGALLFAWGLWAYAPYHLSVGHADVQGASKNDYRIMLRSKRYRPTELNVQIEGLPTNEFHLSADDVHLEPAGKTSVTLTISSDLQHGLHPVTIKVQARDGWSDQFKIEHFAG